jgi:putative transposase
MVATLVRTIFALPDDEQTWVQHGRVVEQLQAKFPDAATMLAEAAPELLAFTVPQGALAPALVEQPPGALNKELRRRSDVVGIFPNRPAVIRLIGAVLAEQHDEWAVTRRYMSAESLAKARLHIINGEPEEVTQAALAEVS